MSDPLTGALNRRGTLRELNRALSVGARTGTATAVVLFDLDHFKAIDDTYGHDAGDEVLKAVAGASQNVYRGSDSFGRRGGEEFLAVLPNADTDGAGLVARRIREVIAGLAIPCPGCADIAVTATIGVAVHTPISQVESSEQQGAVLVSAADHALYKGKTAGRDRVVFAAPVE